MPINSTYLLVRCKDCRSRWKKRSDSIKEWNGRCRFCAQKLECNRPHRIKQKAASAKVQCLSQGGVPNARKFTSEMVRGERNNFWKGGVTPLHKAFRTSAEYLSWRKEVYKRDNYTCQICGKRNCCLHAHHLKSFSKYPELRLDLANGQTLCRDCHIKVHSN